MQPPPENNFSACLAAARVSMFTRRRRGWMVTLFRDMQPPPRKNFPACSGIFPGGPAPYEITESRNARSSNGPPRPAALPEPRPPGPAPARSRSAARSLAEDRPGGARRRSGARPAGALPQQDPQRSRSATRR